VLDGTWATAKKIIKLSENLKALPKIRFTPPAPSRFRIKRQPSAHCVSTIEAAYYLLSLLESQGLEKLNNRHATLLEAIDSLVNFQVRYITDAARRSVRP
jgi:DTW domain-containing protein